MVSAWPAMDGIKFSGTACWLHVVNDKVCEVRWVGGREFCSEHLRLTISSEFITDLHLVRHGMIS